MIPVKKQERRLPSGLLIVPQPQMDSTQQELVQFSENTNRPSVLQTTAIELESSPSQLGSCDPTDDVPLGTSPTDDARQCETASEAAIEQPPVYDYPMTSVPDADTDFGPPPPATRKTWAPASQRSLPGPVNLVIGRDQTAPRATAATVGALSDNGPRESIWPRWTQSWRRKIGEAFSDRTATHAGNAASGRTEPPETPADRSIPAAASEPWYNRRWR